MPANAGSVTIPRVPEKRARVVIAGGGVAALEAMVALRKLAEDRVDTTLLAPETTFANRPLAVAEPFRLGEVQRFELANLAGGCGARHVLGALGAVEADAHRIRTTRGIEMGYDALLVACGAQPRQAVPGALTFRGPADVPTFRALLDELDAGVVTRVAFAVPGGVTWSLPLYELALLTAARLARRDVRGVELTLVTPEEAPLSIFGGEASEDVRALLAARGIALQTGVYAEAFRDGVLQLVPGATLAADRVVALPRLVGPPLPGLPQDADGFVHVDRHGRVEELSDVYAAGDITDFPVKQGGLAAQQADAAAEAIAAAAGADVTPRPFDPVLRGLVLTGGPPRYLRSELRGGQGDRTTVETEPLWWPAGKVASRYLAPYLAEQSGRAFGSSSAPSFL
jgi:sulfide:quinone oxidoreductase